MLVQLHTIIGSSSRICWQVTMCARVDTGKENQDKSNRKHNITIYYSLMTRIICHLSFIIRNIPEQKYFVDIKHVTATADSPDLCNSDTELAYSVLKSFTPQMGITIKEENIIVYISVDIFVAKCLDLQVK